VIKLTSGDLPCFRGVRARVNSRPEGKMGARLLILLLILTLSAGCAPGYYEKPQPAYQQEEDTTHWYTNPETEQEYQRRLQWMDFETSHPWLFRR
jgi:hypothetical protein